MTDGSATTATLNLNGYEFRQYRIRPVNISFVNLGIWIFIGAIGREPRREEKEKMNTDITASVKPEYPVVDRNPPFTKTVGNFNTLDYLRFSTITAVSVTVGYLSGTIPIDLEVFSRVSFSFHIFSCVILGIKPRIRGPSMVTGGLIGVMGGFMYAYQNSAGRLMGFFPNEGEVARYKK